jgi:hypothetical protein
MILKTGNSSYWAVIKKIGIREGNQLIKGINSKDIGWKK